MIKMLVKEILESILRNFKILFVGHKVGDEKQLYSKLKNEGLAFKFNYLSKEKCEKLRCKIDLLIESNDSNVWVDAEGADHRIYFADTVDEEFDDIYKNVEIRKTLSLYTGIKEPVGMLLAARIDHKGINQGSGGGWHRDSPITHQFKAIIYLDDVESENGPFQYIPGSHTKKNVIRDYLKGYLDPGKYRFKEEEIEKYIEVTDTNVTDVVGEQGTLVYADTKCIHRGKPIESGSRYALFCYFWDKKIPEHFDEFRQ